MSAEGSAGAGTAFAPDLGVVRLSRAQLAHLAALPGGGAPRESAHPDPAHDGADEAGHADEQELVAELRRLGALGISGPHAALGPALAVLRRARSRFFLRQWVGTQRRVVEGVIGPAGIVVLPGGTDAHAPQELRHHPRPAALARVLAGFISLGASGASTSAPADTLTWAQVKALAAEPPSWARAGLGPDDAVTVHDLVWQPSPQGPRGSVLALVGLGAGGLVEVVAVDRADPSRGYRLVPRRPEEVWLGLCRLTAAAR